MVTVTGTGFAALAKNPAIAHLAAFMSLVSGTMGLFLLLVKLISVFKSHFTSKGLPERQFLPSFLIVIPIITLFAISAFRLGHYMEKQMGYHLDSWFFLVTVGAFAFQTWYMAFGMAMLKDYIRRDFFRNEYYVTQWGLVCPFVAYAVLAAFVYSTFIPSVVFLGISVISMAVSILLFFQIFKRHLVCSQVFSGNKTQACLE